MAGHETQGMRMIDSVRIRAVWPILFQRVSIAQVHPPVKPPDGNRENLIWWLAVVPNVDEILRLPVIEELAIGVQVGRRKLAVVELSSYSMLLK